MPLAHYVCYNQVSYTVACENALRTDPDRAVLMVAPDRIHPQLRYSTLEHRPLSRLQLARACVAAWLDRNATLYTPHHQTPRLVRWLARLSRNVALVDDGLDTLREQPRNVDVEELSGNDELITFTDYDQLAGWTNRIETRGVCSLAALGMDDRPPLDVQGVRTLVVESPGVDTAQTATASATAPEHLLIVTHSNPNKRTAAPVGLRQTLAGGCSLERTIVDFDGDVMVGETMLLVYALHQAPRSRLLVHLTKARYDNLVALHELLGRSHVRLHLR